MDSFDRMIDGCFRSAFEVLTQRHSAANYRFVKEDVLRYHMAMALDRDFPDVRLELEWKHVDMLLMKDEALALVELKSYDYRICLHPDGSRGVKGGAGSKNFEEFKASLRRLMEGPYRKGEVISGLNITDRYFVLTGTKILDERCRDSRANYAKDYWPPEALSLGPEIEARVVTKISAELGSLFVFGWVIRICPSSKSL